MARQDGDGSGTQGSMQGTVPSERKDVGPKRAGKKERTSTSVTLILQPAQVMRFREQYTESCKRCKDCKHPKRPTHQATRSYGLACVPKKGGIWEREEHKWVKERMCQKCRKKFETTTGVKLTIMVLTRLCDDPMCVTQGQKCESQYSDKDHEPEKEDQREPNRWCATHRPEGFFPRNGSCEECYQSWKEGKQERPFSASFGYPKDNQNAVTQTGKATCCATHQKEGMEFLRQYKCEICKKRANYIPENGYQPTRCHKCREKDVRYYDVRNGRCFTRGSPRQPVWDCHQTGRAEYCTKCADDFPNPVRKRFYSRCKSDGCRVQRSYGKRTGRVLEYTKMGPCSRSADCLRQP